MKKGQTLIEVLVALGLAASIIMSLFSIAALASKTGRYNRQKMEATAYLQDALEQIRNRRDSNQRADLGFADGLRVNDFSQVDLRVGGQPEQGFRTIPVPASPNNYQGVGAGGEYHRYVFIAQTGGSLEVHVEVRWQNDRYKVEANEILTDWSVL